ncbi:MAG: hypothetical protein JXN64_02410 [Spirochaetes bacterium]|nr:hypothetical protein [Spirochaetota bacterium]
MVNSENYKKILNDSSSESLLYECLLCGHEQPTNDICECCGSTALEKIDFDNIDE